MQIPNAFPHIPRQYQPIALVTAGVEINSALHECNDLAALQASADRQADRQEALVHRILAAFPESTDAERSQKNLAAGLLQIAMNAAPQQPFIAADQETIGMRIAANSLGLAYYAEHPELLRQAIQVTAGDNPRAEAEEPPLPRPELAILCGEYAMTTLFPYFQPLEGAEQFRRLFRELPAPLIFAGLGHVNALALQQRVEDRLAAARQAQQAARETLTPNTPAPAFPAPPPAESQEAREAMALAAGVWLTAGAFTAAAPELLAAASGGAAVPPAGAAGFPDPSLL